jgi:pimeloyl-ACP methyl ester carboxylesterase
MQLHTRVEGEGPAVILLHGLFGDGANLAGIARPLRERYQVWLPDQRNHGQSPHAEDCSYLALADDIVQLIHTHQLGSVHLVGHSMGGKAAMTLALQHPEQVRSLTVIDIPPRSYPLRHRAVFGALRAVAEANVQSRQEAQVIMAQHIEEEMVRQFLLKNLVRTDSGYQWRLNWQQLEANGHQLGDFPVQSGHYRGPTQFLIGADSDYVTAEDSATIPHWFPQARIHSAEGAGHWVHAQAPQWVVQHVQALLASA